METFAKRFRTENAGRAYFVGANTSRGFVSDHRRLLSEDEFKKVYIIKGGSGTGKSTLIRKAASAAESAGARCTRLLCGSDPDSLDGAVIEKDGVRIGIMDGTAPHTVDPVYAGACGEIVNCGDYWDSAYLEGRREELSRAVKHKKYCFETAYRFLRAAGEIYEMQQELARDILLFDKMEACAHRLAAQLPALSEEGSYTERRTLGITMRGAVRLGTFDGASKLVTVEDCACLAPIFMDTLRREITGRGYGVIASEAPTGGTAELFVPAASLAVTVMETDREACKNINMHRFADSVRLSDTRQRRRFTERCFGTMLDAALENLEAAGREHFALEEIYKSSMDFASLDSMSERLSRKIVSYFDK